MKSGLLLWIALNSLLCAQQGGVRIAKAVTDEELTKRRAQVMKNMPVAPQESAKAPIMATKPVPSLMSRSDTLSFGGLMTLVPKRAILYQPPDLAKRVNQMQPGSKIVGWSDFLQSNRGWITTVEVTMEQVQGLAPIDEKVMELHNKGTTLVVATYNRGPISVLPQKTPEADVTKAENKAK